MNCPDCGSPTLRDQQYCRSCGAALSANARRRINPRVWGLMTLVTAFGGLMIAMTGKMLELRWLTFTGVFILMGGMFLLAILAFLWETRPRKRNTAPSPQEQPLSPADTTNKLLPIADNDFIPSVTERTTDLLKTASPNRSVTRD
jgi:hypothetical protein